MHIKAEKVRVVLLVICINSILPGCAGKQWAREGTDRKMAQQNLTECEAIAKMQGRADFPELLVVSSMEFEPNNVSAKDINQDNFSRAKLQYLRECMLDKGYSIQ